MSRESWENVHPSSADDEIIVTVSEDGSDRDEEPAANRSNQTMLFQHSIDPGRDLDILCALVTSQRSLDADTRSYANEIYVVGSEAARNIRQIVGSGARGSNAAEIIAYNEETYAEAVDALFNRVYSTSQRSDIIRDVARAVSMLTMTVPLKPQLVADNVSAALRLIRFYRENSRCLGEKLMASESELSKIRRELHDTQAANQDLYDGLVQSENSLSIIKSDASYMYRQLRDRGIDPLRSARP